MMNKLISKLFIGLVGREVLIEQVFSRPCSFFRSDLEVTKSLEELGYGA